MGRSLRIVCWCVVLLSGLPALAQPQESPQLPKQHPNVGQGATQYTPPILFRQTFGANGAGSAKLRLECIRRWTDSGRSHYPTQVVTLTDADKAAGFVVTGGGCEQVWPDANFAMIASRPYRDDGWFCATGDLPSVPPGGEGMGLRASLVACRIAEEPVPFAPRVSFASPADGTQITVARRGAGFRDPIPRDMRVCNGDIRLPLTVSWNLRDAADPSLPATKTEALQPRTCIALKTPTSVQFQVGAETGPRVQMGYETFRSGTFAVDGAVEPVPAGMTFSAEPAPQVGERQVVARCEDIGPAPRPGIPNPDFSRVCPLRFPARGNYRVCLDKMPFETPNGRGDWPISQAALVIDRALRHTGIPPNDLSNPKWTALYANSCRDLYNVREALVLIGPGAAGDLGKAKDMKNVHVGVSRLR